MMSRLSCSPLIRLVFCGVMFAVPAALAAQAPAYISAVEGRATIDRAGETQEATINMPLVDGDRLRTDDGRLELRFPDGSAVEVEPYSEVEILGPTRVRVLTGAIDHVAAPPGSPRAISAAHLPPDLQPYTSMFDRYGTWQHAAPYGYVWYPAATAAWRPYDNGYWTPIPRYGWTWIGLDVWSWPTHHYGRWGYSRGAWFWIPGRTWGAAWVSWSDAPGYVSWCPLGFDNRPVFAFGARGLNTSRGWSAVPRRAFGRRDLTAHRSDRRYDPDSRRLSPATPINTHTQAPIGMPRPPENRRPRGEDPRTVAPPQAVPRPGSAAAAPARPVIVAPPASAGVRVPQVRAPQTTTSPAPSAGGGAVAVPREPAAPREQAAPRDRAVPRAGSPNAGNRAPERGNSQNSEQRAHDPASRRPR